MQDLEPQPLLGLPAAVDVGLRAHQPRRALLRSGNRPPAAQHPAVLPVRVPHPVLVVEPVHPALEQRVDGALERLAVGGVDPVEPGLGAALHRALGQAQEGHPARRVGDRALVDLPVPEPVAGRAQGQAVALPARAQGAQGLPVVRDVAQIEEAGGTPLPLQRGRLHLDDPRLTAGTGELELDRLARARCALQRAPDERVAGGGQDPGRGGVEEQDLAPAVHDGDAVRAALHERREAHPRSGVETGLHRARAPAPPGPAGDAAGRRLIRAFRLISPLLCLRGAPGKGRASGGSGATVGAGRSSRSGSGAGAGKIPTARRRIDPIPAASRWCTRSYRGSP